FSRLRLRFRLRLRCRWREEGHLSHRRKEQKQHNAKCNRQHSHDRAPRWKLAVALRATHVRRCRSFRTDYRLRTAETPPDPGVALFWYLATSALSSMSFAQSMAMLGDSLCRPWKFSVPESALTCRTGRLFALTRSANSRCEWNETNRSSGSDMTIILRPGWCCMAST